MRKSELQKLIQPTARVEVAGTSFDLKSPPFDKAEELFGLLESDPDASKRVKLSVMAFMYTVNFEDDELTEQEAYNLFTSLPPEDRGKLTTACLTMFGLPPSDEDEGDPPDDLPS